MMPTGDVRGRYWQPGLVIGLSACYAAACLITQPARPISMPDSAGYIASASIHSLGYPAFVKVLGANRAIVAQPILFAVALAYLGIETLAVTGSIVPAVAATLACMVTPQLTIYHAAILTESIFISGLVCFLAATVRFIRQPSQRNVLLPAVIAGLTATVRRTGYVLLLPLVVVVLLNWSRLRTRRAAVCAAAIVPMLGIVAVERVVAHIVHLGELPNLLGRHLFAKAAIIDAPPSATASGDPQRRRLEERLEATFVPIRRLLDEAPADVRTVLTLYYEACLEGRCVPEFAPYVPGKEDPALARAALAVALERMSRAPVNVAALAVTNYRSLWVAYKLQDPHTTSALTAFFDSHRPLPFEKEAFALGPHDSMRFQPDERVRFIRPLVVAVGWLSGCLVLGALGMAIARVAPPPDLQIACLASLTAHGGLILSALLGRGIARYMVGVWPAVTIAMVYMASWLSGGPEAMLATTSHPAPITVQDVESVG